MLTKPLREEVCLPKTAPVPSRMPGLSLHVSFLCMRDHTTDYAVVLVVVQPKDACLRGHDLSCPAIG